MYKQKEQFSIVNIQQSNLHAHIYFARIFLSWSHRLIALQVTSPQYSNTEVMNSQWTKSQKNWTFGIFYLLSNGYVPGKVWTSWTNISTVVFQNTITPVGDQHEDPIQPRFVGFCGIRYAWLCWRKPQKFNNKKHVASPYGGILPGWNSAARLWVLPTVMKELQPRASGNPGEPPAETVSRDFSES